MDEMEKKISEFTHLMKRLHFMIDCANETGESEVDAIDKKVEPLFEEIVRIKTSDTHQLIRRLFFLTDQIEAACDNNSYIIRLCSIIKADGDRILSQHHDMLGELTA